MSSKDFKLSFTQVFGTLPINKLHKFILQTNKHGAFLRGSGVNLESGRFTAPATAAYSFHGTVIVAVPKGMRDFARKDFITASICIDGKCKKNM